MGRYTKVESYHFRKLTRFNFWYILIMALKDSFIGEERMLLYEIGCPNADNHILYAVRRKNKKQKE